MSPVAWVLFKKSVFLFIEEHPGVRSEEIAQEVDRPIDLVLECIEVLNRDKWVYWREDEDGLELVWRYYAYPRPTSWEHLLRDDMV